MFISLIFSVFNKETTIESVLASWIDTVSGHHQIEVVAVFDDPQDDSIDIARHFLRTREISACLLTADDMYEIHCNQLGFQYSRGEWVIFVQDDNWMHDQDWDRTFASVVGRTPDVGVIGFLAGANFLSGTNWERIEVQREHKDELVTGTIAELGVWQCDTVCRPFAISAKLLTEFRGLNLAYCPLEFDDMDVCVKAIQAEKRNLLIPFDLVNTKAGDETISREERTQMWSQSFWRFKLSHRSYLDMRTPVPPEILYPVKVMSGGLRLV